jgi:hypothetical protein
LFNKHLLLDKVYILNMAICQIYKQKYAIDNEKKSSKQYCKIFFIFFRFYINFLVFFDVTMSKKFLKSHFFARCHQR